MKQLTTITNDPLYYKKLANGLPVYVLEKPGFQKKYAIFATNYGSLDSKFSVADQGIITVPDGIAHFLEHKLFEEEEEGHVFQRFAQYGASVNAYTGYNMTAYLFSTIDFFEEALLELLRFVQKPYLTEENVLKEQGIIEQELRMYDDNPDRRIYRNLLESLYHQHPIRLDVGGTVDSIKEITVDLLHSCYNLFYQPSNMVLFVAGDVDAQSVSQLVSEQNENWQYQSVEIERVFPDEPSSVAEPKIIDKMSISLPRYYRGFKSEAKNSGKALLKQQFIMNMIWHSIAAKSSPLFEQLYDINLVNDSFGASFQASPRYAYSFVGGETDDPDQLDAKLEKAIVQLQEQLLTNEVIERVKRQSLGNYLASFDSLEYVANSFITHLFNGTNLLDIPEVLESITVDDVNKVFVEELDFKRSAVSILLPK